MGGATRLFLLLTSPFPLLHRRCPSLLRLPRRHRLPLSLSPFAPQSHILPLSSSHPRQLSIQASQQFHSETSTFSEEQSGYSVGFSPVQRTSHPWPEWSSIVEKLSAGGYFNRLGFEDEFVDVENLPDEFVRSASACLSFARDRPDIFGMLPRRDIEVVVENGTPFLFKNVEHSMRRMRSIWGSGPRDVLDTDKADTVDLMRFLLSYISYPIVSLENNNHYNIQLVESSVRNILRALAREMSFSALESKLSSTVQNQFSDNFEQTPRPFGRNVEMKRGDWICTRCSFMNFAKNVKCLECEEPRPKRQLTGGEWECPQCDFFNYGRNAVCLRCDCKRPGEVSLGSTNSGSNLGSGNENRTNKVDVDSRLAANEEKAQRWFSKISQLDSTSDMSSAIADEDFPEIMPLRKGVNRFVVSTRKTALERRLANVNYQGRFGNDGSSEGSDLQSGGANKSPDAKISKSLDEILGRPSSPSESSKKRDTVETDSISAISSSVSPQYGQPAGRISSHVPFVPLPADMFAKKPENSKMEENEKAVADNYKSVTSEAAKWTGAVSESNKPSNLQLPEQPVSSTYSMDKEKEEGEKSERWFKKVAELHNVTDLASEISDKDFPEIMPLRKGENRFVVSRKKDRSLTSPMNKRRMAMEQSSNTNFVPFVPFPPDYFAKKDKQQSDCEDLTHKPTAESRSNPLTQDKLPEKSDDSKSRLLDGNHVQGMEIQPTSTESWNSTPYGESSNENKRGTVYNAQASGTSTQNYMNPQTSTNNTQNLTNITPKLSDSGSSIRSGWTGKSLEGSAVKEPDPLDMSEEAKAERWFRRVAQIKDISELSEIPDEDFPSIMPMRKGVNRFVVSKRKTPLERRLTSTQYRKNLPIVNTDPLKKENDGN